jgi:hypothetical protein
LLTLSAAAIDAIVDHIDAQLLAAFDAGAPPTASGVSFLLRRYATRESYRGAGRLGLALAESLSIAAGAVSTPDRAAWLIAFADASSVSSDDRLPSAIGALAAALMDEWCGDADLLTRAVSIDACLRAVPHDAALAPRAVDELEHLVGSAYRPGTPIGGAVEHVSVASALLTAFHLSARLPYAMLAEELMQTLKRRAWDDAAGRFVAPFDVNCEAARVLVRLSALHCRSDYRAAAVLTDADYGRDADLLLAALAPDSPAGLGAAAYGVALLERTGA